MAVLRTDAFAALRASRVCVRVSGFSVFLVSSFRVPPLIALLWLLSVPVSFCVKIYFCIYDAVRVQRSTLTRVWLYLRAISRTSCFDLCKELC